jgi:NACHT domain
MTIDSLHQLGNSDQLILFRSIIAEYLKDQYRSQEDVGVACVYCNFKDQDKQTPTNLIASIWRQLAQCRHSLSEDVKQLYTSHHGDKNPTLIEVVKILHSEINRHSKVFLLVDALDECSEENGYRMNFNTELQKLLKLPPKVNILVTSRDLDTIARCNKDSKKLEIKASTEDIQAYVQRRISEDYWLLRHTQKDSQLRQAIVKGVIEICEDM